MPERSADSRARAALSVFYGLAGVLSALWVATLPAVDERLDLGPGRIGTLLLLLAVGALATMPIAGRVADRWGSRRLLRVAAPVCASMLCGVALAPSYGVLAVAVVPFGAATGAVTIALNVHGVEVERGLGKPVMGSLHGVWSLGGVIGGAVITAALAAGADVRTLMVSVAVAVIVVSIVPGPFLLTVSTSGREDAENVGGPVVLSAGMIALMGGVVFAAYLSEATATDWAAVHARWELAAEPATASVVYTAFAAAMTVTRFLGDPLRARLGPARTMRFAGSVASTGYALVLAASFAGTGAVACAIAGWSLVGVGMATVVPVIFSTVGAMASRPGRALSAVTTISFGGALIGPAVIGYVAEVESLGTALLIPAVFAVFVTLAGPPAVRAVTGGLFRQRKS
ncbi:MFS transporter [Herbidospora mongoliensis]|uniref:MFS transporter n=1 Tax=Herbidospora mongoliensis TaxID=688067 RepID=UPI00083565AF|nr:MFS transporter [Herbidospora mongoliensis]